MKYSELDYSTLGLSPDLAPEDIHKIREYEYQAVKDLSPEEFLQFYHDKLEAGKSSGRGWSLKERRRKEILAEMSEVTFHRIKEVESLEDFRLKAVFVDGATRIFDVKPLFEVWEVFGKLKDNPGLFNSVTVAPDGCGVIWNDEIDLFCNDLYEFGEEA